MPDDPLSEMMRRNSTVELRPAVLIRSPADPDVAAIEPGRWRPLDDLVAELGTEFDMWDHHFDIASAVAGELGRGRVALLVLEDPDVPRRPTASERVALGIPPTAHE